MTPAPDATSPASQVGFARFQDGRINIAAACMAQQITNLDLAEALLFERKDLEGRIADLEEENARLRSAPDMLADPNVVHVNMLRGGIAKPTPTQIGHLYRGEQAAEVVREVIRQNPEAAPAPIPAVQSGAVASKWGAARNLFVTHAERFVNAARYEEASAIADKAAREIEDLFAAPQSEPLPGGVGEARFVAGPVWKDDETDEDGGELWTSEVQTMGGYSIIATVHGGSEAEASARRDAILAALSGKEQG